MKYLFTLVCINLTTHFISGQSLSVSTGRLIRIENFPSQYIQARHIDIWLPTEYSSSKKYGVLYMQDGQMLFHASHLSNQTEWKVHETIDSLTNISAIPDYLVVGIWNIGEDKIKEYFPEKVLSYVPTKQRKKYIQDQLDSKTLADEYLKFLVLELSLIHI